jgi:hypothetical protein
VNKRKFKMFRKALVSVLLVLAVTSAAWAQPAKAEITVLIGHTLADGVSGDTYHAGNGQTYDRVGPARFRGRGQVVLLMALP